MDRCQSVNHDILDTFPFYLTHYMIHTGGNTYGGKEVHILPSDYMVETV